MAINDFFQTTAQIQMQGRQTLLQYAYRQFGGADAPNVAAQLNSAWEDDVLPELLDMLGTDVQVQCVYSRQVEVGNGIPCTLNFEAKVGTTASTSYPGNSPFVIKRPTTSLSSRANGRQYISGVAKEFVTNGGLSIGFLTTELVAYIAAIGAMITSTIDVTYTFDPGVISFVLAGAPRVPPVFHGVGLGISDGEIKSQRRRRSRRTQIA